MSSNKDYTLDEHYEKFVADQVAAGRFNNASEVIQAGLRILEDHETRRKELRSLIDEGDAAIASGKVNTFHDAEDLTSEIIQQGKKRLSPNE